MKITSTKPTASTPLPLRSAYHAQRQIKYFAKNSTIFSAFWLMETAAYLERNPYDVYWDYREELSKEQLQTLFEGGYEAECELEQEIYENCWESIEDGKNNLVREEIKSAKPHHLLRSFIERMKEEDEDVDVEDFYDLYEDDIDDEVVNGPDALLRDYVSYDMCMKDLYRNSSDQTVTFTVDINSWITKENGAHHDFDDELTYSIADLSPSEVIELGETIKNGGVLVFKIGDSSDTPYYNGETVRPDITLAVPASSVHVELSNHWSSDKTTCKVVEKGDEPNASVVYSENTKEVFGWLQKLELPDVSEIDMTGSIPVMLFGIGVDSNVVVIAKTADEEDEPCLFGHCGGEWCNFTLDAVELSTYWSKEIKPEGLFVDLEGKTYRLNEDAPMAA